MNLVSGAAGALLVLLVVAEAFEALVLPRRVTRPFRFSRLYYQAAWAAWKGASGLVPGSRRATFLSAFGPLSLIALFAIWAAGLIVGFGLLHRALSAEPVGLAEALYLSGATFSTLGYGDVVPAGRAARLLAVVESSTGFGYFAVVIGYLPVLYQAFSRRETLISLLDARAGSPPTAGELLRRAPPARGPDSLGPLLAEWERWAAELLESHLSYPVLSYYRSQHDNQSWAGALTAVLDTCAVLLAAVEGADGHQARLTFAMARHAAVDLALVARIPPLPPQPDRLPEAELARLWTVLHQAGSQTLDQARAATALAEIGRAHV